MKVTLRKQLFYGFLPAFTLLNFIFIFYSFYIKSTQPIILKVTFLSIIFYFMLLIIKKSINLENVVYYMGFKRISDKKYAFIFFSYYILCLIAFGVIFKDFIPKTPSYYFTITPFLFFFFVSWILNTTQFMVTFLRIMPNTYLDLVFFELHTEEELNNYTVIPMIDIPLTTDKLLLINKSHLQKIIEKHNIKDFQISKDENCLIIKAIAENKILWEEEFILPKGNDNENYISEIKQLLKMEQTKKDKL